jgi:hypothetical protein
MKDNVIQFPLSNAHLNKVEQAPQTEEQRQANIRAYQQKFILDSSIEMSYKIFDDIGAQGMDLTMSPKIEHDMLMICEAIKATMLRACNIPHPLHKITEQIISAEEGDIFKSVYETIQRENLDDL